MRAGLVLLPEEYLYSSAAFYELQFEQFSFLTHTKVKYVVAGDNTRNGDFEWNTGKGEKLAALLDTTVGYLLGENEDNQLLKNPKILQRLQDIQKLSNNEQEHIFITLYALIRDFKNKKAYAS